MAYVIGTANSLADLLTAIQNACTANGWILSGNVLHKGICYVGITNQSTYLQIRGGTGIDGSNNLTGIADTYPGSFAIGDTLTPFTFPVTYEVFIGTAPDEVYTVINYSTSYYQQMSFGQSAMPGLSGTGNWYCGCRRQLDSRFPYSGIFAPSVMGGIENDNDASPVASLFNNHSNANSPHGVHHALDSSTWFDDRAYRDMASLIYRQPSQWNGESILIPIRVYASRPSGFISPVLECAHARFVNLAGLNDGQIITLGSDKWKVYPFWKRGTSFNSPGTSWYAGHAFRYDGP